MQVGMGRRDGMNNTGVPSVFAGTNIRFLQDQPSRGTVSLVLNQKLYCRGYLVSRGVDSAANGGSD